MPAPHTLGLADRMFTSSTRTILRKISTSQSSVRHLLCRSDDLSADGRHDLAPKPPPCRGELLSTNHGRYFCSTVLVLRRPTPAHYAFTLVGTTGNLVCSRLSFDPELIARYRTCCLCCFGRCAWCCLRSDCELLASCCSKRRTGL